MQFRGVQVGGAYGRTGCVRDQVAACRNPNAMRVVFLRTKINDRIAVSEFLFEFVRCPDFLVRHDKHRVRPLLSCLVITLRHAAEVLAKRRLPCFSGSRIMH